MYIKTTEKFCYSYKTQVCRVNEVQNEWLYEI